MPEAMKTSLKRIGIIVAVNLAVFAVCLLVLELVFGDWINPNRVKRLMVPRSIDKEYSVDGLYETDRETIRYTRDVHGLRGTFADPAEIDILTVGGSTTDQRYIDNDDTWQAVIQQCFAADGKTVFVANAGVDGQSTFGHLKSFDWWFPHVPGLRPTVVLFYVGVNDFYIDDPVGQDDLVREELDEKTLRQVLGDNSALWHLQRTMDGMHKASVVHKINHTATDFGALTWTREPLQTDYDALMSRRLADYAERLRIVIKRTRKMGAEPVFVTQPARSYRVVDGVVEGVATTSTYGDATINGVDYCHMMRKLNATTTAAGESTGVLCIDVAGGIEWKDDDFYDFYHFSPKGARKGGAFMYGCLRDRL